MAKLSIISQFSCVEGQSAAMDAALAAQVAACDGVDGVEIYSYHRGEGDTYGFFALFSSQDAMQALQHGEAMQAAMATFGPLLAGPPSMSMTEPLSAHGFDC